MSDVYRDDGDMNDEKRDKLKRFFSVVTLSQFIGDGGWINFSEDEAKAILAEAIAEAREVAAADLALRRQRKR